MTNDSARFVRWAVEGIWLLISTPYNQGFVSSLKSDVPFAERSWDKERRLWKVTDTPHYRSVLRTLVADHYDVDLEDPEVREEHVGAEERFASPGAGQRQERETAEFRRILELERELRQANADRAHLNQVIRSLNADNSRLRATAGLGGFGFGGGGLLEKLFRTEHGAKAFKKLSTVLHPDAGGDTELFKELEGAWSKAQGKK